MRRPQRHTAEDVLTSSSTCKTALVAAGERLLGKVREGTRAVDLALVNGHGRSTVVRCVTELHVADHHALSTMVAEGDFTRAFIVYTAEDQPHLSGEIEAYPLSRIDELAALLAKESAP